MTPARWQQVKEIFDRAAELGPASRIAYIRERCGDDEALRKEVESLIASDGKTGSLLDNPLLDTLTGSDTPFHHVAPQDDSFGPYVPVRVLGEGGMGTVYLARQLQPIRRDVALKVVKLGMDSRQVLERFEIERQSLALMDYPNVARVLDAGTSQLGRPYFVMEYVDGVPITQYCDGKSLSTRERLRLFIPVCNALQHAHKKGIIHRDVKPSNILVTEVDGKPVPKVIDFGIARAIEQGSVELNAFTLDGQIIGTPEYMSPEQASLDSRDIDTGTDVYSLGVVLYELLAGALPLDLKSMRKLALGEVLRAIRETPVPAPGARVTHMGADADRMALRRSTNPGQLKRDLAGDIDSIVMKAIDKDRHCRYPSASEFAADIERYLKGEPVLAGPPGAAYRMRKFVVRHKLPVAAALAVALALIAGIGATTWEARVASQQRVRAERQAIEAAKERDGAQVARDRATAAERTANSDRDRAVTAEGRAENERNTALAEKRRANEEAAIATAVNGFLQNDLLAQSSAFRQVEAGVKPDPDLKVRTALDRAAARIAGKFDTQPLVEASIRLTIGDAYVDLGQYPQAKRELARVLELRRRTLGEDHPETLRAMEHLGRVIGGFQGNFAEGELLLTKAVEVSRRVLGEKHPATIDAMNTLGEMYLLQFKYAKAEPLLAKALELSRRVVGEDHFQTRQIEGMDELSMLYFNQSKFEQAESLATETFELSQRVMGEDHPSTSIAISYLGTMYSRHGQFARAEPLLIKSLELTRRVMGEEHLYTLMAMGELGIVYQEQGKDALAEPLLAKYLQLIPHAMGDENPFTMTWVNSIGLLYVKQGKYALAEPVYAQALEIQRRTSGEESPKTLNAMEKLGNLYRKQGKHAQAELLLSKVLEVRRRVLGATHPSTANSKAALASLWLAQRRYADAEPLLREALSDYANLPNRWERYEIQSMLGGSLCGQQKYTEAERLLLSGYQGIIRREGNIPEDERAAVETALGRIAQLYQDWGKREQAVEWQAKLETRKALMQKIF